MCARCQALLCVCSTEPTHGPACHKPVCPYCIMHWSGDIVNDEISVAGCTGDCNSDSPRCGQWWRVFVGFALATSSFQCKFIYLSIHLFIYTVYICTLCRILAFWLMFFVLHTTINKVYLILSYLSSMPWLQHRLSWGNEWMSNHIQHKTVDVITYPCSNRS